MIKFSLRVRGMTMVSSTVKIKLSQFMIGVDKNIQISDVIPVYTDGSCVNNGKTGAISSIGVHFPTADYLYFHFWSSN